MKLTLLGTGTSQGVPVIACTCKVCRSDDFRDKHLRTSALVETDEGLNILIDIGPDFREQMLRQQVMHVDSILVTHAHRDHVAGLDDIRSFNYVQRQPMQLFGNVYAMQTLQNDYKYIFSSHRYPGLPEADLHVLCGNEYLKVGKQCVQPVCGMHKNLPVMGFRIGPVGYVTDMNQIEDDELKKLEGVQVLVVNALRHEPHFSHFCLPEALNVIERIHPRQAFLTHLSHQMGLYADLEKELPGNVMPGYDGLQVELPKDENNFCWQMAGKPKEYVPAAPSVEHNETFFEGPGSSPDGTRMTTAENSDILPYYSDASAPKPGMKG